jgi:hypothetical protein
MHYRYYSAEKKNNIQVYIYYNNYYLVEMMYQQDKLHRIVGDH